ncbi:N-6 DNA methylase [Nonomuraea sp. NPDC050394]|uniref:N-6 DNA methylase n=1 Tax=Nonomuraea sp. NPDC050394 TaxID=3364363 RepID=UPI0037B975D6
MSDTSPISTIPDLISAALQLGADQVSGWSAQERDLSRQVPEIVLDLNDLRERILAGHDPLGDAFCRIRDAAARRPLGQTYTPPAIIASMVAWAANEGKPSRVVDPGSGSGRYLLAAAQQWPKVELVGVDIDPVAALMARANLAVHGLAARSHIELGDYRASTIPTTDGQTLYLGNPPYVRHHQIQPEWKKWLVDTASRHGLRASQLAGLHVYFFLATVQHGAKGDLGSYITSAEWLDVNYGSLVRELLLDGLGGEAIHVLEPTVEAFADAATTAAVTCFRLGASPSSIKLRQVKSLQDLGSLEGGREVARERLIESTRWSPLVRVTPKLPEGYVELGELVRVHRGQVTGANNVWVGRAEEDRIPERFLFPSITRARELFAAGDELVDASGLRPVIDLPTDLDELDADERRLVDRFLDTARSEGAADTYIARARKAWWSVGLRQPAPILATYMARRPPAFVRNLAEARHINIAHGLYPRQAFGAEVLDGLAAHLRVSVALGQGRTYAGGLTKFEPREMERLPVPSPEVLLQHAPSTANTMDRITA